MSIIKADRLEIEIQEQKIEGSGCKFLVLVKTENKKLKQQLKVITTDTKPIIKNTEATENTVITKNII